MPPPRPPSRSPRPAVLWCASPAPVRIWTPAPPTGAGLLLPLTGRPAASLLTWRPAGLGSPLCCPPAGPRPPLYGLKLVPSSPPVGSRPFSPPTETGPPALLPACGRRLLCPSLSGGLVRTVICPIFVCSAVPWGPPPGPRPLLERVHPPEVRSLHNQAFNPLQLGD